MGCVWYTCCRGDAGAATAKDASTDAETTIEAAVDAQCDVEADGTTAAAETNTIKNIKVKEQERLRKKLIRQKKRNNKAFKARNVKIHCDSENIVSA